MDREKKVIDQMNCVMKKIWIILIVGCISCANNLNQKEEKTINYLKDIDKILESNISYKNEMNGMILKGLALRPGKKFMINKKNQIAKEGGDTIWDEDGIIKTHFDNDSIQDYLVLTLSKPLPFKEGSYEIYAIMGKSRKCFLLENFPLFKSDYYYQEEVVPAFLDFEELPYVNIQKNGNLNYFFIQRNTIEEVYNPYYFNSKKNKFEVKLFD
jgi:hypothetical protein